MNCKICGKEIKAGFPVCGECLPTGWISVKDRLPTDSTEMVLVTANGHIGKNIALIQAQEIATYSREEGWILECWPEETNVTVTHWMPLPAPPKEA